MFMATFLSFLTLPAEISPPDCPDKKIERELTEGRGTLNKKYFFSFHLHSSISFVHISCLFLLFNEFVWMPNRQGLCDAP